MSEDRMCRCWMPILVDVQKVSVSAPEPRKPPSKVDRDRVCRALLDAKTPHAKKLLAEGFVFGNADFRNHEYAVNLYRMQVGAFHASKGAAATSTMTVSGVDQAVGSVDLPFMDICDQLGLG